MATIILEDNQSLSNKNFTIPKKLIQQLKTTADIVDNTYSDKGDESYKKSLGYKRNQKLTNDDYNTRKNEGENNVISYGELKRWKHDLDHMTKSKKNLAYVLNGGEEANVFVNNTLNQARNAVAPVNKVKKSDNISKSKLKPSLTNTKTANIDKLSTNQVKIHESIILSENREGKNINLARRLLINNFNYSPQDAQAVVDEIRRKIPNSRVTQCKFLSGIARMYAEDELTDNAIVNKLNKTLLYISSNAHVDEYDYNLNDLSSQELVNRFATNIENDLNSDKEKLSSETFDTESDYNIVRINSFQEANKYSNYTTWCVTQDADAYNNYTNNGERIFYFCVNYPSTKD